MSEISKLYENAEVKKQIPEICSNNELYCKDCKAHIEDAMPYCKNAEYPPFTAEKQLNLMAFLINRKVELSFKAEQGEITVEAISRGLAGIVNRIWADMPAEEKQQVKVILE